jgi:hypothetical protein
MRRSNTVVELVDDFCNSAASTLPASAATNGAETGTACACPCRETG